MLQNVKIQQDEASVHLDGTNTLCEKIILQLPQVTYTGFILMTKRRDLLMQSAIFSILGLLIGLAVAGAGIYYWQKEKHDQESVKIYRTITVIGAVITIGLAVKIGVLGL